MSDSVSIKIHGLRELERDLRKLPRRVQGRAVRNAARAGGIIVRRRARELAPRRTGNLRRSIVVRSAREGNDIVVRIGLLARAFYGFLLEFGTRRISPRPWMRPAFDQTKEAAAKEVSDRLWREIEKGMKK